MQGNAGRPKPRVTVSSNTIAERNFGTEAVFRSNTPGIPDKLWPYKRFQRSELNFGRPAPRLIGAGSAGRAVIGKCVRPAYQHG